MMQNPTKIKINDVEISYLKIGNGPKVLLLIPGTLGTIFIHFKPQIENLDREKYTIVVFEPPGYGNSRPPDRDFSRGFFYRDADYAISLMKILQFDKYSLLGWCSGGDVALIMAFKVAERVDKIVVWGCRTYITENDIDIYENKRDFKKWPEYKILTYKKFYGESYFPNIWSTWVDTIRTMFDENEGNICREILPFINVPTLILHGSNDDFVPVEHAIYLQKNMKNATLKILPDAPHDIHRSHFKEFNTMIDTFLSAE